MPNRPHYLIFTALCTLFISCQKQKESELPNLKTDMKATYYTESFRNQFHFSPEANWMNDPNGMVYHDGEYHLFYQYYPDSTVWGPMHWGHAVSQDLLTWEHLPIALYPDSLGYIFSGSAVIDKNNTAEFGENAMIAIYTYHDPEGEKSGTSTTFQYQAIAYSTDKGRTFTKYEGNPVIPNPGIKDFRDPKVIWDEDSEQWVMVFAAQDHIKLYGSKNLKEWTHLSDWGKEYGSHGGVWECPDLFPIQVQGSKEIKWVLLLSINPGGPNGGSATQYFIGDFDGQSFRLDEEFETRVKNENAVWFEYGADNYAGVTWSNAPVEADQRLFIGWMSNWQYAQVVPSDSWRSAMTLPRTLELHQFGDQYTLVNFPIAALSKLEVESDTLSKELGLNQKLPLKDGRTKLDINTLAELKDTLQIKVSNDLGEYTLIGFDPKSKAYFIDRSKSGITDFEEGFATVHLAPASYAKEEIEMTIYVDHASIELIADKGRTVMTDIIFPRQPYSTLEISVSEKDTALLNKPQLTSLKRIW